ncbi:MAG: septum formation family protein [Corynebacterium sp.]|nr:septum formation family protein [Corynebacterium sp.]
MNTVRTAPTIRLALAAAVVAVAGFGITRFMSPTPETPQPTTPEGVAPFTTADVGACLTWEIQNGKLRNFEQTDCAQKHRFEVSSRENLATYPSSEFGPKAPLPDVTRQAQLREELCKQPTVDYLQGRYDPSGRYSVAPILPPPEAWKKGDRTMLCGLQVTDDQGNLQLTTGRATEQDQARVAQPGECVRVDAAQATHIVDCAEAHTYEVTGIVDLATHFPNHAPSIEEQDGFLKGHCTQVGMDYIGGDDAMYNSTLQTFWTTIPVNSWTGGTHTVNCSLIKANEDGTFATLKGSAKGPFTINDAPPPPQPTRNPLRNPQ